MSTTSQSMKFKFAGFLKNLMRKFDANDSAASVTTVKAAAPAANSPLPAKPGAAANPVGPLPPQSGKGIQIPLTAILATLPLELRGRIRKADVTGLLVTVATERILPQLRRGVVRVTFGEIRQAQPHVFTTGTDRDSTEVLLPLGEILSRLNPRLLVRRVGQKHVNVPAEITSPFGAQGQGLIFAVGNPKTESPAVTRFAAPAPVSPSTPPTPITPIAPTAPAGRTRCPFVPPPPAMPSQIFQRVPTGSNSPATPISPATPMKPVLPSSPTQASQPKEKDPLTSIPVARAIRPAQPAQSIQATPPSADTPSMSISLSSLAQGWPEALRREIVQLNLTEARLALPEALIETALKRGRVIFPWKVLRSWIRPAPPVTVSGHDGTELELPLSVLAPLFMARQKGDTKLLQRRVAIDDTIPNLFFGLPKPDAVPSPAPAKPPVNKVVDTNYYIWDDVHDRARVDETEFKRQPTAGTDTGTDFIVKYATPNEIVSRAAALDGVAGVVIALPDGLMVANRIPPDLNGDTLAAFLPQIFSKVSQTTKELRMGELNNLSFTVGNVPWKIFRVNAIYFAAFGRTGEALPMAPLAALAAELDRKNK